MVYTLLYVPCVATLSAEIKEVGVKWTMFGLVIQLAVAYVVALIVHLIGLAIILWGNMAIWALGAIALAVTALITLSSVLSRRGGCGFCAYASDKACDGAKCAKRRKETHCKASK